MVRAKFKVDAIRQTRIQVSEKQADGTSAFVPRELRTIEMSPVWAGSDPEHENYKFWKATPSGRMEFGCVEAEAVTEFTLGQEFYVDFTPCD